MARKKMQRTLELELELRIKQTIEDSKEQYG